MAMDACVYHPDHGAIESCEVCRRPLCGLCLWYTEDGHRLCEAHARERAEAGTRVLPPQTYREAIATSLLRSPAGAPDAGAIYQGNSNDVGALVAAIAAFAVVASCMGGAYCLPLFIVLLGAATYANADKAIDPRRTRLLAGTGIGVAGLFLLGIFAFVGFYILMFAVLALSGGP